jgi:hypothetical protein
MAEADADYWRQQADKRMHELLGDISSEADDRNCFSQSDARMDGTDRYW